jgi:hypothetical protein
VSFLLAYPSCRHSFLLPTSDLFLEVGKVTRFEGPCFHKWPISLVFFLLLQLGVFGIKSHMFYIVSIQVWGPLTWVLGLYNSDCKMCSSR